MVIHMHETRKKYTVLLLSAPIGSGHRLAAEALEQAFADRPEVEVIHGNIFDFFPQFLGKAFLGTYLWILKCCPWLYKLAYSWGNKQGGSLWLRELLNRLLARLGGSYLRSVQPDAVIATHATPAGIIGYYKKAASQALARRCSDRLYNSPLVGLRRRGHVLYRRRAAA